ncbi:MAG: TolC family protein [Gemmatimonadaceae bacterium]|nr:TolC family protein [Gemmatimonadaceae bacterium]
MARRDGLQRQLVDARATMASGQVRESTQWLNPTIEWRRENLGSPLQPDIFATAYVPFDLSGRRLALRGAGQAGQQRVESDAMAERRAADLHVAQSWLDAAANTELAAVMRGQASALAELARIDSVRVREGLVAEAVGLRTSIEADRAQLAAVRADRDAAQSLVSLSRQLGTSIVGAMLAALTTPVLPAAPDSVFAVDHARRSRPELRAREAAVLEARRRLAAEQRGVLGEVQLQGGTKETSGFMTGQLGVAMPLPLFNRNDGARARATGGLREATVLQRDALLALRGEVERTRQHYMKVQSTMTAAVTFDQRATALVESARVAYREGHMTLTELLDAERAAVDARTLHRQWLVEAWMARLTLELTLGGRLDSDSPLDLPVISNSSPDRR